MENRSARMDGNFPSKALKDVLKQFDQIFLIPFPEEEELVGKFCTSEAIRCTEKRILVLSTARRPENVTIPYRQLEGTQMRKLQQFYHLYEFSDHFQILSRNKQFGSIWNLLDTGLLNSEELFQALLGPA